MGTSDGTLAHLFATYNMFYGVMHGIAYTLHEKGVTLTQREPPVRISQPAAPITPRVHGPLDEWLVPSSIGSVHDLDLEDDDF